MLGRKSKLSRRNKRTLYKMCIRTVLTYASPIFPHAAPKALRRDLELPTLSKYMKDASKRFFDIVGSHPNALLRPAVDYQPPPPTHFILRSSTLAHLLHPAAADRSRPGKRNGNRPVTVSGDILCRDDTLQESSIGHVTRRRHSHVPSGRVRGTFLVGFSPTLCTHTGARVCGIDISYPLHVILIMPEVVEHESENQTPLSAVPCTVVPADTKLSTTEPRPCVPAPVASSPPQILIRSPIVVPLQSCPIRSKKLEDHRTTTSRYTTCQRFRHRDTESHKMTSRNCPGLEPKAGIMLVKSDVAFMVLAFDWHLSTPHCLVAPVASLFVVKPQFQKKRKINSNSNEFIY
ncbi:hypothetical protein EVAR_101821_1 [Eumeta japonica]|uniref:RNA-directed DNA polymerase from mobile element jockey n=1 Tax=Eumeta variegata TaxID=151549 RepID=A0A4C1SMP2_EUMVA|nr:hypothetical protein EVAR_101821_1 [Eumeta japonica]